MQTLIQIAETRIREAIDRGEFDDLPGAGRPVRLDDDPLIPEELRVAYRMLKNAGCLPPEVELRREISSVEALLIVTADPAERSAALRRLDLLRTRLDATRPGRGSLELEQQYFDRIVAKLGQA